MGEVDAAFLERICKTAERTAVIAGNTPEDLGKLAPYACRKPHRERVYPSTVVKSS